MTRPARNQATPYVVVRRYLWRGQALGPWDEGAHRRLADALQAAWDHEVAWLRLVGGQAQPFTWVVIDIRDYAEYRRGIATGFGETSGTDEKGHPYARREHRDAGTRAVGGTAGRGRGGRGEGRPAGAVRR